ncbi:hypothetical protein M0802_000160 [Mischocyttarus mexicanus]|nr:hypothetical protein M0802_000160 [Mischocyttarus mexicanus]
MQPPQPRVPYCKTYEEIRLEEIQAESAAYYSYNAEDYSQGLADRSLNKYYSTPMSRQYANVVLNNTTTMTNNNRRVLQNSEIRRKIRVDPTTIIIKNEDNNVEDEDDEDKESMIPDKKKLKVDNINKNKKKKKKKWSNDDNDNDESNNELNFKILSLDEIRRRKISKTSLIQGVDDERLENVKSDLSKMFDEKRTPAENVISVVEDPGKTITNPLLIRMPDINFLPINRGIKRVLEKDDKGTTKIDDNKRRVKTKFNENYNNLVKVPPVRLRRSSPRRCLINITINESIVTKQDKDENKGEEIPTTVINDDNNLLLISDQTDLINKEINEIDDNVERNNENLTRRLDENLDVRVNSRDSNHSNNITGRKNEVEVRLCDSSTDEERMRIIDNDESNKTFDDYAESEKTKSVVIIDTITEEDSKASRLSCDSILNINDDEYLTLDTASDDILKDIDALLKDKPVL